MTRTKICGITRVEDALACAQAGADAIGLVFYARSPRAVDIARASGILRALPAFVTSVALFVDPEPDWVRAVVNQSQPDLLQFHGDEPADFCKAFGRPYIKAVRVRPETDLLQSAALYDEARALLLDAYSPQAHGGTGQAFDWDLIPRHLPKPIVLAGGLGPENVADAIRRARPWAVDVSSGVEAADGRRKGIKDTARIRAFMDAVRITETA